MLEYKITVNKTSTGTLFTSVNKNGQYITGYSYGNAWKNAITKVYNDLTGYRYPNRREEG